MSASLRGLHGGPFLVREALGAGYADSAIRRLVATGEWTRLRRGICVETALLECGESARVHALHVAAALLALAPTHADGAGHADRPAHGHDAAHYCGALYGCGAVHGFGAVGSHESAAVVHGIALLGPALTEVTLTRPPGNGHRHRLRGARIHLARVSPEQVRRVHSVPVTSPARTVVDLARRLPYEAAVVAADSAMYRLGVTREQLTRIVNDCPRWRGNAQAARVVEAAEPRARSPLETLGRLMCAAAGLPRPAVGMLIGAGYEPYTEVDLYWREQRVVVLLDGMLKYDDPRSNRKEKLTQERLENEGFIVVRLTWTDVTRHPDRSVTRIRQAFSRAAGRAALS